MGVSEKMDYREAAQQIAAKYFGTKGELRVQLSSEILALLDKVRQEQAVEIGAITGEMDHDIYYKNSEEWVCRDLCYKCRLLKIVDAAALGRK